MATYSGQTTGTMQGDIDAGYIVNGTYLTPGSNVAALSPIPAPTATPGTTDANFLLGKYTPGMPAYDPNVKPTAITPESLNTTQAFPLASANTTPVFPANTLEVPQLQATDQEKKASGMGTELGSLYDSLVGKSAYQNQQESVFGVDTAQKAISDLAAQLTGLKNEAAAIPLQLEQNASQRGITTTSLGRQENSRLRTNAIAALGVSTLLAAAQGQLANAQALADKAVAQKYDPILEKITALKANLEIILNDPLTTLAEKNRALAQQALQDQKEQATLLQKQNASEIWNVATTAASNGATFKPSGQYTTLAQTLDAISKAPTKEQALQIAVSTGLMSSVDAAKQTSDMQEYALAKQQGFKGTFQQWVDRSSQYKSSSSTPTSTEDKSTSAFLKSLAGWDMVGTREQFIRRLEVANPDIDPASIQEYVYYTYPDGYDK